MILIIVDIEIAPNGQPMGFHTLDIERRADNKIGHPDNPAIQIDVLDFVVLLNANAALRHQGGWDQPTRLPGHAPGTTRWDILVAQSQFAGAPAELAALNLVSV